MQVAKLTVIGIFQPSNAFMEAPLFVSLDRAKALLDIDSTDLVYLYLTLDNPKVNAVPTADSIQKMLAPRLAALPGRVEFGNVTENVVSADPRMCVQGSHRGASARRFRIARPSWVRPTI